MRRNKNLPLTGTVFYILLALREPIHGYLIMQQVEELSNGVVRMAERRKVYVRRSVY